MTRFIAATATLTALAAFAVPAAAQTATTSQGFTVVETNAKGQATKVSKDGKTYAVCMSDAQDSCINPREAGLKFGNNPLSYWPGKPASEIEGPIPATPPR